MNRLLALAMILSVLFTSCTKPTTDDLFPGRGFEDNRGGNNATIPAAVLSAFNNRYSSVTGVEWKQLSDGNFKVEFFKSSVKWQTIFTPTGAIVKEEHD